MQARASSLVQRYHGRSSTSRNAGAHIPAELRSARTGRRPIPTHAVLGSEVRRPREVFRSLPLFLNSALVRARDAHIFAVFRHRATRDLDAL